ncbi:MAG TPA: TetR/AcrR family transcriptional regulator [Baekduia sp.]|jgi:AcrR family transcriptional regulator
MATRELKPRKSPPAPAAPQARDGAAELLRAGVEVMAEQGYHGSSIRDIARRANMSTANLYHHFSSKQELLLRIMVAGIDELKESSTVAMAAAPPDPPSQLAALVIAHVEAHAQRSNVSYVTFQEIRHLTPEGQAEMRAKMDEQQRRFDVLVDTGIEAGVFHAVRPRETARALASMCTAVATWYSPDGPRSPRDIAEHYVGLSLAMLGVPEAQR